MFQEKSVTWRTRRWASGFIYFKIENLNKPKAGGLTFLREDGGKFVLPLRALWGKTEENTWSEQGSDISHISTLQDEGL